MNPMITDTQKLKKTQKKLTKRQQWEQLEYI